MRYLYTAALLLSLTSAIAFGSEVPNELTRYTSTNGTVAPKYRKVFRCQVYANRVVKQTTSGFVAEKPVFSVVAWTDEVRDADELTKLVDRAAEGNVTYGQASIGGRMELYEAVQTVGVGSPKATMLLGTGSISVKNSSPAAEKLVEFTKFNCVDQ